MQFIDLKKQQNIIRKKLNQRISDVLEHGQYIMGPEVSELEDHVFSGPSMVFTNIKVPRSEFPKKGSEFYVKHLLKNMPVLYLIPLFSVVLLLVNIP